MVLLKQLKGAKGFDYSSAPQRSPEWLQLHVGRVGASQLGAWLAVSKRDGKPLKARLDLEREIAFSKAFNVSFSRFTTAAMQAGIDNEDFVRQQYSSHEGVVVDEVGCFYNDYFVASPDGLVGKDGGLEIKWLQDSNWTEVLLSNKPLYEHYLQCQGNLWASGRKWWDYVAASPNTGRFIVIRVLPDAEIIAGISKSVVDVDNIKPLGTNGVFEFSTTAPVATEENIWG